MQVYFLAIWQSIMLGLSRQQWLLLHSVLYTNKSSMDLQ